LFEDGSGSLKLFEISILRFGNFSHNHQSHSAPGSGGGGAYYHGHRGSNGRPGMVIVTEYL
jgi:hypothetical protein